jgi:adenylate kinase
MRSRGNVVILLGPPGSGKGTQAARLSEALGIPAISTGEMLRLECQSGSSIGKAVRSVLASGQFVSDDLMNRVVAGRLGREDCRRGCILDGYPRTVSQARFLQQLLTTQKMSRPVVFDFEIESEGVIARLGRRRQCAECGRIITVDGEMPVAELLCDRDGSKLVQRADDNPAIIRERLRLYHQNAGQLVEYYARKDFYRICATRTPEQISEEVLAILGPRVSAAVGRRARTLVRPQYHAQPA